ncbi:MAG: SMP-30/gluconolactonase/LRE family protein [Parvularculales bacterium]
MTQDNNRPKRPRKILAGIAGLLGIVLVWLFFWPVPFDPAPDDALPPNPAGSGVFVKNGKLAEAGIITTGNGPEGIAFDGAGRIYSGLGDGSIIRVDGSDITTLANTGGRPLGVEFDADGQLIIADSEKGLLSMAPDGSLATLVDTYEGEKMIFVDDLAIAGDGKIYFSDATTRYHYGEEILEAFERRPTGRLFVYDPKDGSTRLLLDGLHFANGVALGPDDIFVLVNETFGHRIMRFWLNGPRAGKSDVFAENLPGFLDNITEAPGGGYWLAVVAPRTALLDALAPSPFLRKIVWRILNLTGINPAVHHSWAVKLDENGAPIISLEDDSGHIFNMTSVIEFQNRLYLGNLTEPKIGVLEAP